MADFSVEIHVYGLFSKVEFVAKIVVLFQVHSQTGKVCSVRDLGLRQYIMVYKEITEHVADLPPATPGGTAAPFSLTASIILNELVYL